MEKVFFLVQSLNGFVCGYFNVVIDSLKLHLSSFFFFISVLWEPCKAAHAEIVLLVGTSV